MYTLHQFTEVSVHSNIHAVQTYAYETVLVPSPNLKPQRKAWNVCGCHSKKKSPLHEKYVAMLV